jgi:integrase
MQPSSMLDVLHDIPLNIGQESRKVAEKHPCRNLGENMPNQAENGLEMTDNGDETEGVKGKATKFELPKILTYEEIDRFLLAIDDLEDMLAARTMLFGGLRVGEASELLVRDIDLERCSIFVRQGKWSKDRYAPVDVHTASLVNSYAISHQFTPDSRLINASVRTIQRHIEDIYHRSSITWGATCHTLRHTCATWQLDKGIPLEVVRENLGHEDISTTQIYLHLNIRQRSRTYRDAVRFGL